MLILIIICVIISWCLDEDGSNRYTTDRQESTARDEYNMQHFQHMQHMQHLRHMHVTITPESAARDRITPNEAMRRAEKCFYKCLRSESRHSSQPYNTGSGSSYVALNFLTTRASLKEMWRNKRHRGFVFKASDSWSDDNAIDLKVSNSENSPAFFNYHLKVVR